MHMICTVCVFLFCTNIEYIYIHIRSMKKLGIQIVTYHIANLNVYEYTCVCIYIYEYIHTPVLCIYIYIYDIRVYKCVYIDTYSVCE